MSNLNSVGSAGIGLKVESLLGLGSAGLGAVFEVLHRSFAVEECLMLRKSCGISLDVDWISSPWALLIT